VGTTADLPVAPADVPPWLDPLDTQDSSQTLLSQTQVQDDDGQLPITTTAVTTLLIFTGHRNARPCNDKGGTGIYSPGDRWDPSPGGS